MSLRIKGRRTIVVDGQRYFWKVGRPSGYWLTLYIHADIPHGQLLSCTLGERETGCSGNALSQWAGQVIMPSHIHQIIHYNLDRGWKPLQTALPLFMAGAMDDKIKLDPKHILQICQW